jgi:hypothetical protein
MDPHSETVWLLCRESTGESTGGIVRSEDEGYNCTICHECRESSTLAIKIIVN